MTPPYTIAHYKIVSKIGEGGMGVVYRATDTKLNRDVAIKVLPSSFANDYDRLARFTREAQVLASLNHPYIATIYGVEDGALVMELVDGLTLAELIARGKIPLDETLLLASQLADALEYAHEQGIVHRDLKPANIKITSQGRVKVLDFGLAKALGNEVMASPDPQSSPTLTMRATSAGTIMGTAAYMSPEQASGKPLDKRTDIWSFGVVLFEMLTGKRLFEAETVSHTLADVLRAPLDLNELPVQTPTKVRELIRRCLDRNVRTRLRDIGEARVTLGEPLDEPAPPSAAGRPVHPRQSMWQWLLAVLLLVSIPAAWFLKPVPEAPLLRLEVVPPPGVSMGPVSYGQLQVSPDGTMIVFVARDRDSVERLWLREFSAGVTSAISGTENGSLPYWSPDSRQIAFMAGGKLKRVELATRRVVNICDASTGAYSVWTNRGLILLSTIERILNRVPASGGTPVPIFSSTPQIFGQTPQILPEGDLFLFQQIGNPGKIVLGSTDGKILKSWDANTGPSSPGAPIRFASNPAGGGWLLSHRPDNRLVAHLFRPRTGELTGDEMLVAHDIPQGPSWSTSDNGVLAYRSLRGFNAIRQLTWVERDGTRGASFGEAGDISYPRMSPDRKSIVYTRDDEDKPLLFLYDSDRKTSTRLTLANNANAYAEWMPDGRGVVYAAGSPIGSVIAEHPIHGAGDKTTMIEGDPLFPTGVSPDGKLLAARHVRAGLSRLVILSLESGKSVPLGEGVQLQMAYGSFSPDGRWLLYSAAVNGRSDVFVRPVHTGPGGPADERGPRQISTSGGSEPLWRADGKEIFYIAASGMMTALPVEVGGTDIRPGPPTPLFPTGLTHGRLREYDVTPDGKRFLMALPQSGSPADTPITVIVNWPRLLERK